MKRALNGAVICGRFRLNKGFKIRSTKGVYKSRRTGCFPTRLAVACYTRYECRTLVFNRIWVAIF